METIMEQVIRMAVDLMESTDLSKTQIEAVCVAKAKELFAELEKKDFADSLVDELAQMPQPAVLTPLPHVLYTPATCPCDKQDEHRNCMVCDGGLAICSVCGQAEGTLAESCPGPKTPPPTEIILCEGEGQENPMLGCEHP